MSGRFGAKWSACPRIAGLIAAIAFVVFVANCRHHRLAKLPVHWLISIRGWKQFTVSLNFLGRTMSLRDFRWPSHLGRAKLV